LAAILAREALTQFHLTRQAREAIHRLPLLVVGAEACFEHSLASMLTQMSACATDEHQSAIIPSGAMTLQ
jgi:hypothetical protein